MDKLNSEMKKYNIKIGKTQMSKTQYLELIKNHHKSLDIKKNNKMILPNSINFIKLNNEIKNNNIISPQNQKENEKINNNKKIIINQSENLREKLVKEQKEINLLTIETDTKKQKNIKQPPKKKANTKNNI